MPITWNEIKHYCVSIKEKPLYAICGQRGGDGGVLAWCMSLDSSKVVANYFRNNRGKNIKIYTFKDVLHQYNTWKVVGE